MSDMLTKAHIIHSVAVANGYKRNRFTEFPAYLEDLSSHLLQSQFNIKFVKRSLYDEINKKIIENLV